MTTSAADHALALYRMLEGMERAGDLLSAPRQLAAAELDYALKRLSRDETQRYYAGIATWRRES